MRLALEPWRCVGRWVSMLDMRTRAYSIGLVVLLSCLTAQATTLRHRSLSELVDASDLIVVGQTEKPESFWHDTRIVTRATLHIEEVWVGRMPQTRTVEVWTLGGVVGTIGQQVDGMVTLQNHQRAVWQLTRGHDGIYWPVGLAQGVWIFEPETAQTPRPKGAIAPVYVRRSTNAHLVGSDAHSLNQAPQTLAALKAAILEAAHGR